MWDKDKVINERAAMARRRKQQEEKDDIRVNYIARAPPLFTYLGVHDNPLITQMGDFN